MTTNDYSRKGNSSKPAERFWNRKAHTYVSFERRWKEYLDQLNFLRLGATLEEQQMFDESIRTIMSLIEKRRKYLIERGDIVKVNEELLREDHDADIISAHLYLHIIETLEQSKDRTLTVAILNDEECHCYATGVMMQECCMPIIEGEYLVLVKKAAQNQDKENDN